MRLPRLLTALASLLAASVVFAEGSGPAAPASVQTQPGAAPGGSEAETSVASSRSRRIRETPGVVTVLTRDELLESGARDLAEVLARVPGFELAVDVASVVGAGFRGIWGHEGKILYMVDGVEMNDISYGTFPLVHHLKVDQLDRIEIIRGPGSALYGGHAELAVVNVITRAGLMEGAGATLTLGRVSGASTANALSAAGGAVSNGVRFGATASIGTGAASGRVYTDVYGDRRELADASEIRPALVTARAMWRDLDVRVLYDDYALETVDGYDAILPDAARTRWRTAALDARGSFDLGGDVTLLPRITYRWERPWQEPDPDFSDLHYDVTNERLTGRLALGWDSFAGPSFVGGAEAWVERGRINGAAVGLLDYDGERSTTNSAVAAFVEAEFDTRWVNVLAGARLERHSEFGTAFVPRLAATRLFGPFHAKLLASGAYRTPSIENVNYAPSEIRPERTWVFEAELGWQPSEALYAAVNVFDLTVDRPIVFSFAGLDAYANEDRTGSRGAEAELHALWRGHTASVSYAFYSARGKNRVPDYAVAGEPGLLVGFAGHKLVASVRIRPFRGLVLSPSLAWLSERAAFDGSETPPEPAQGRIGARTYLDLFASWRGLGAKGLEVGVGLKDVLDQGVVYVQPYPGGHAPFPGNGREVWLRLSYEAAGP